MIARGVGEHVINVGSRDDEVRARAERINERVAKAAASGEPEPDIPAEVIAEIAAIMRPGLLAQQVIHQTARI